MNSFVKGVVSALVVGAVGVVIWYFLFRPEATPAGVLAVRPTEPGTTPHSASSGAPSESPVRDSAAPRVPRGLATDRIMQRGSLIVGTDFGDKDDQGQFEGTPPMFIPGANGKPPHDGFDVRIAQAIARELGVANVEFTHEIYSKLPSKLTGGTDIDVVISGYVPSPEYLGVAWSEPYYDNFGLALITRRDSVVHTVDDLRGKVVGLFDDEAAEEAVRSFVMGFREPLVRMDSGYLDALIRRKFDGFVYDAPYAGPELADWCAEHGQPDLEKCPLMISQFNLNRMTYNVGIRQTEPDLMEAVNTAIRAIRGRESEYRDLVQHYLGKTKSVKLKALSKAKVHTVLRGESLGAIAATRLGSSARWTEIWELNRAKYDNPNLIYAGDELLLP